MRLSDEQVQRVADLEDNGILTPKSVVDDARKTKSPLHELFQWNDALAAEEHRLDQARAIIRSVEVIVQMTETTIRVSSYVRDPTLHPEQGYRRIQSPGAREHRVEIAVAELDRALGALRRAQGIALALGVESGVDAEIISLQSWREHLEAQVSPMSAAAD
jgi:hypothetical protein